MANGTRTGKGKRRKGGGRPHIDWTAARRWFVTDPTVSFGEVARRFGISEVAVRHHAHSRCRCCLTPWEDLRRIASEKADEKLTAAAIKGFEERQADTILVAQKLRRRVLSLDDGDVDAIAAVRTIPRYATLEQLYAGEATDRIAIAEVQTLFEAGMRAARTVLEEALSSSGLNGKRGAVLAYFDEALPTRISELTQGAED